MAYVLQMGEIEIFILRDSSASSQDSVWGFAGFGSWGNPGDWVIGAGVILAANEFPSKRMGLGYKGSEECNAERG